MTLKSVRVPSPFLPAFERAEGFVSEFFSSLERKPEDGSIRIGGDRYVLLRCESLFLAWHDAMTQAFGEGPAREFIYNTAREIGRSDARAFSSKLGLENSIDRLASGPVHFAHAGWASVEILPDSSPVEDETYFLHYHHPNTFETDVLQAANRDADLPACLFSAGYSAGWCTDAFGLDLHGRELRCVAQGHHRCEFIMSPAEQLNQHEERVRGAW